MLEFLDNSDTLKQLQFGGYKSTRNQKLNFYGTGVINENVGNVVATGNGTTVYFIHLPKVMRKNTKW